MNDATETNLPTNFPTNLASTPAATTNPPASHATVSAVTPGWKTSEFWMTAVAQIGLVLAAASGALPTKYAVLAGSLSQVAYSVSRGMAKSGPAAAAN